jgi:hypothetical protein
LHRQQGAVRMQKRQLFVVRRVIALREKRSPGQRSRDAVWATKARATGSTRKESRASEAPGRDCQSAAYANTPDREARRAGWLSSQAARREGRRRLLLAGRTRRHFPDFGGRYAGGDLGSGAGPAAGLFGAVCFLWPRQFGRRGPALEVSASGDADPGSAVRIVSMRGHRERPPNSSPGLTRTTVPELGIP